MGVPSKDLDRPQNGEAPDVTSIKSRAQQKLIEREETPALDKTFLDAAQAAVEFARKSAAESDRAAEAAKNAAAEAARDTVRNYVARLMLVGFLPSVLGLIILIVFLHWRFPDDKEVADRITGIYKDMVLPVITLILGYFFGKR